MLFIVCIYFNEKGGMSNLTTHMELPLSCLQKFGIQEAVASLMDGLFLSKVIEV